MNPFPLLRPHEPAPWFTAASSASERFHFSSLGGVCVVLTFLGSARHPVSQAIIRGLQDQRALFNDRDACWFGVSNNPVDHAEGRLAEQLPGLRFFKDFDAEVSRLYGVEHEGSLRLCSYVIDRRLRIAAVVPVRDSAENHVGEVLARLREVLGRPWATLAPVLVVPELFEPRLCRDLIAYYECQGGQLSGVAVEEQGLTVVRADPGFKMRRDVLIEGPALIDAINQRITRRLAPEIARAFQFRATRIERFLIACYDADEGGYFRPHRDNTTRGTAHRCFAVSINLNAGDFDGGDLRFPEFGPHTYRAPSGGAVVFSCSLLHEATPVTRGRRYAVLPFLYDEAAAAVREANQDFVDLGG